MYILNFKQLYLGLIKINSFIFKVYILYMGLGKRDLDRKRKSLENKLKELELKSKKNPLNKELQEEIQKLKKKLEED